jgi:CheY-like chemotaxis protein
MDEVAVHLDPRARMADRRPGLILMADDDAEDCLLVREALAENHMPYAIEFVRDGEELLDYLCRRGKYQDVAGPLPDLILLDLKMPRKDGREALKELKGDSLLKCIPIVVFTTSMDQEDIGLAYRLGVNSYVTKPATFRRLLDFVATLGKYWFEFVERPQME